MPLAKRGTKRCTAILQMEARLEIVHKNSVGHLIFITIKECQKTYSDSSIYGRLFSISSYFFYPAASLASGARAAGADDGDNERCRGAVGAAPDSKTEKVALPLSSRGRWSQGDSHRNHEKWP